MAIICYKEKEAEWSGQESLEGYISKVIYIKHLLNMGHVQVLQDFLCEYIWQKNYQNTYLFFLFRNGNHIFGQSLSYFASNELCSMQRNQFCNITYRPSWPGQNLWAAQLVAISLYLPILKAVELTESSVTA